MTVNYQKDGYCGLFCGGCPCFGEECGGCKSNKVEGWCADCGIKKCAKDRGFEFCSECNENPCQQMQDFINDPNYPYHKEVVEYLSEIKSSGKENWFKTMEQRWACKSCGTGFRWWTQKCTSCGAEVEGYKNPQG